MEEPCGEGFWAAQESPSGRGCKLGQWSGPVRRTGGFSYLVLRVVQGQERETAQRHRAVALPLEEGDDRVGEGQQLDGARPPTIRWRWGPAREEAAGCLSFVGLDWMVSLVSKAGLRSKKMGRGRGVGGDEGSLLSFPEKRGTG